MCNQLHRLVKRRKWMMKGVILSCSSVGARVMLARTPPQSLAGMTPPTPTFRSPFHRAQENHSCSLLTLSVEGTSRVSVQDLTPPFWPKCSEKKKPSFRNSPSIQQLKVTKYLEEHDPILLIYNLAGPPVLRINFDSNQLLSVRPNKATQFRII